MSIRPMKKFGFTVKFQLHRVFNLMGLVDRQNVKRNSIDTSSVGVQLTKEECEFVLELISKTQFYGKDVELVYETVLKIQQHYESLSPGK